MIGQQQMFSPKGSDDTVCMLTESTVREAPVLLQEEGRVVRLT